MEQEIIKLYVEEKKPISKICEKFNIGKLKVKKILSENNIPLNKKGGQVKHTIKNIDYSIYENKKLKCKKTSKIINDVLNKSGSVSNHLKKEFNLQLPTLYKRNMITKTTGRLWYEDYFDLIDKEENQLWTCPVCDWETKDINNDGGSITKHIKKHNFYNLKDFFDFYPKVRINTKEEKINLNNPKSYIKCKICDQPFRSISNTHLKSHNITQEEYKKSYGEIFSEDFKKECSVYLDNGREGIENNFTSKGQKEILEYVSNLGFNVINNHKKSLGGTEIDIFIPNLNIGFEYNGLFWHSEKMGKDKDYHLNKQILAQKNGIKLFHIFSDEWIRNEEIIKSKIKHILNKDTEKIYARKCIIREISGKEKDGFLKKHHIQGIDKSTYKIGAYYNEELVAVMTFSGLRKVLGSNGEDNTFELVRFASKNVVGIASRLLKYFIKKYKPNKIISYADKRWTLSGDNLYQKIGFNLVKTTKPNYWYALKDDKRYHRFNFRKDLLVKKGYDTNKTEKQIMGELGYLTVWDCGNYKYEMIITN